VLGGFGLHEVDAEDEEEEEDDDEEGMALESAAASASASASASGAAAEAGEGGEDDEVELGYLSDVWCVDLQGVCRELDEAEVSFTVAASSASTPTAAAAAAAGADSSAAKEETAWAYGGAKRGCKLVNTSQGIFSFGGFDGSDFCSSLERIDLKIGGA
jgi:hypothetical protein